MIDIVQFMSDSYRHQTKCVMDIKKNWMENVKLIYGKKLRNKKNKNMSHKIIKRIMPLI